MLLVSVLLAVLAECAPSEPVVSAANHSVQFRLVATEPDDRSLLTTTDENENGVLSREDRVVAEWVFVDPDSPAQKHIETLTDGITRATDEGTEILVLHSTEDVSSSDIDDIVESGQDNAGQPVVLVNLNDGGAKKFFQFSVKNRDRNLAVIADGTVRAVPALVAPVAKQVVLTPTRVDKVRVKLPARN